MAKPTACPLPPSKGIYWLKIANKSYVPNRNASGWSWDNEPNVGWVLAQVDPQQDTDYKISAFLGSDSIAKWDCDYDGVVVEVGPKIEEPN